MFELIYTSAPKGILPGRTGFSTVAFTAGMPPNLLTPLENLSGYEFTFQGSTLPEACNPPTCSFVHLHYGNTVLRVASRIAPNGLDYTMRNNKIAHHLLFEHDAELDKLPAGAAGLFGIAGNFETDFTGAPHELPVRHVRECSEPAALPAAAWAKFAGDAGWAGVIASRFFLHPEKPFYVEYPQTVTTAEKLQLLLEVTELLPPERRKDFTFSTYFTRERPGEDCFLRMIPDFSPLLGALKRFHPEQILVLGETRPIPEEFAAADLVTLARRGHERPEPPPAPPAPPLSLRLEPPPQTPRAKAKVSRSEDGAGMPSRFTPEPRVRFTKEYVEDKPPRNWRPWVIAAIVLLLGLLLGTYVYVLWEPAPIAPAVPAEKAKAAKTSQSAPAKPAPPAQPSTKPAPSPAAKPSAPPPVAPAVRPVAKAPKIASAAAFTPGHFSVIGNAIVYTAGTRNGRFGGRELHDGDTLNFPAAKFNESRKEYVRALQKYFEKTGSGEPYTAARFQKELDEIFQKTPLKQLGTKLQKLIDDAPFGRCEKAHFKVEEMKEAVRVQFERKIDDAKAKKTGNEDVYGQISRKLNWKDAENREKYAMDNTKKNPINQARSELNNNALNGMKNAMESLPLTKVQKAQLLDEFFAPLNLELGEKGKRTVKELEAPNELTPEMLATFCKRLDDMIEYKTGNEAAQ